MRVHELGVRSSAHHPPPLPRSDCHWVPLPHLTSCKQMTIASGARTAAHEPVTCAYGHLHVRSLVYMVTCVYGYWCIHSLVYTVTAVYGYLCARSLVCTVTAASGHLCKRSPLHQITCVHGHRCIRSLVLHLVSSGPSKCLGDARSADCAAPFKISGRITYK